MNTVIDTAWHPLADGNPPDWATGWGEDRHGVFVAFSLAGVTQRLRWFRRAVLSWDRRRTNRDAGTMKGRSTR
jgi:hypothetical protein